jgi:hypothetical protein
MKECNDENVCYGYKLLAHVGIDHLRQSFQPNFIERSRRAKKMLVTGSLFVCHSNLDLVCLKWFRKGADFH